VSENQVVVIQDGDVSTLSMRESFVERAGTAASVDVKRSHPTTPSRRELIHDEIHARLVVRRIVSHEKHFEVLARLSLEAQQCIAQSLLSQALSSDDNGQEWACRQIVELLVDNSGGSPAGPWQVCADELVCRTMRASLVSQRFQQPVQQGAASKTNVIAGELLVAPL